MAEIPDEIKARLATFCDLSPKAFEKLKPHEQSEAFERMVCYDICRLLNEDFSKAEAVDAVVGGDGDTQLDSISVFVNGQYVSNTEDYQRAFAPADVDAVSICIVQATLSRRFEQKKMSASAFNAADVVTRRDEPDENELCTMRRRLIVRLLEDVEADGSDAKVEIRYCYVAMGDGWDNATTNARARAKDFRGRAHDAISRAAPRAQVSVEVYSLKRYLALIDEVETRRSDDAAWPGLEAGTHSATITGARLLEMPAADGIARGYVGSIDARDFVSLLEREDGLGVIDDLGKHNVRRFLSEDNPVNMEIGRTVEGPDHGQFAYRNNGVVIIADQAEYDGSKLTLANYHIVNGLQTSNILYNRRQLLENRFRNGEGQTPVVVKIAVTRDAALREAISKSSNRQTAIADLKIKTAGVVDRLAAAFDRARIDLPGFDLVLEPYDGALEIADIDPLSIVTRSDLLRAVGATLLRRPHAAAEGVSRLSQLVPDKVFAPTHPAEPYLMAAQIAQIATAHIADTQAVELRFRYHVAAGLFQLADRHSASKNLAHSDAILAATSVMARMRNARERRRALDTACASIQSILKGRRRGQLKSELEKREREFTRPFFQSVQDKRRSFDWRE